MYSYSPQVESRSIVFNLIVINVLLLVVCMFIPSLRDELSLHYIFNKHHYAELFTTGSADLAKYPNLSALLVPYGHFMQGTFKPLQLFTHMFMHGGWVHLFSNMFALFMFGTLLERVWGPQRFLQFYLITGFGAVVLHMAVQAFVVYNFTGSIDPALEQLEAAPGVFDTYFSTTVGASGAVFGILVGFGMLFPNTELMMLLFPVPIKAKYFVTLYVLFEVYMGFSMYGSDNVAHFAHLGGALFGFILVKIWNRNRDYLY